jgi:hypothetical protein
MLNDNRTAKQHDSTWKKPFLKYREVDEGSKFITYPQGGGSRGYCR